MKNLRVIYCAFLAVLLCARPAAAQGDPLVLQKRAIGRIDAFVDFYRRTGDMRTQLGQLGQADVELTASNRLLAAGGDWANVAVGMIKQGHVHRMQGQWADAIVFYRAAEQASLRARNVVHQSDALAWRALAESSQSNVGQAFADATEAVRLAQSANDVDLHVRALDVLGTVQLQQGDLSGAADTLNREVAAASSAKDPTAPYYAYINRSDVYLKTAERCDYERTFAPCYEALDLAKADLDRAFAIARKLGFAAFVQQVEESVRNTEARRAMVKSQESMHKTIQNTKIFHPMKASDVLVTQTFVAPASEVPAQLAQMYQQSKQSQKQLGGFADIVEARTHFVDGAVSEMRGDNDAALASYVKAVDTLDRDRRTLHDDSSRGTFADDRINYYYAAVQQLLQRGRHAEAFEMLERSRSRALADLLASRRPGFSHSAEQKLYGDAAVLRTKIADDQDEELELASQPDAAKNAARLTVLQNQVRALDGQYRDVVARMGAEAPRLQNLVVSPPATLAALQQSMRTEHFELLQYLVLEHAVIVWHIGPDAVTVKNVFLPRSEVIEKVAALQKSVADRTTRFDETTARELFLYLVQPILKDVRADRLVIVPHEDLNYIPFQVLQDPADRRFLGERFQITYAPSASILLGLKASAALTGGRLLAVADPAIPAAGVEVAAIAKLFPNRNKVIANVLAPESDVKIAVRDFDIIHLSVHGKFDAAEPMLSYLSFTRGTADDGKLTAAEMFGLPLENSRLVVLSACETGRAEVTHGNETLGMVRALMYAGASTLVLSYWEVDSDATALWMETFYQAALTHPLPEAARMALVKVKSNPSYSHPYYWAAFAMVGR
ncbi:MAG TPA: CHAT domain-containing protein [Vicinamibacterales bacterium]